MKSTKKEFSMDKLPHPTPLKIKYYGQSTTPYIITSTLQIDIITTKTHLA